MSRLHSWIAMFALLCLATASVGQTVYKWVDKNGQVHFSQTPQMASQANAVVSRDNSASHPELAGYCGAIRTLARQAGGAARNGVALASAVASIGALEKELIEHGATTAGIREVVYFVYGMQAGLRQGKVTTEEVAEIVANKCMSGNFAIVQGFKSGSRNTSETGVTRSGTGWVGAPGHVVTSLHVVDGAKAITLHFADGSTSAARVAESDRDNDVAVLSASTRSVPSLSIRAAPLGRGASVFTIGFPHSDVMGVKPKLSNGVISSTSGVQDDASSYQISVPVQAGNSGGPLLDMDGAVVGIVSSKLRAGRMYEKTGDLTENVNYAVKSSFVTPLLGDQKDAAPPGPGSLETLARVVEPSIVRIVVEG